MPSGQLPPHDAQERLAIVAAAKAQAEVYAALGWPVTPSCCGGIRNASGLGGCLSTALQELHPAHPGWRTEATTDPAQLASLWRARPAYGIIAALSDVATVLQVAGRSHEWCVTRLGIAFVRAPVLRRLQPGSRRTDELFVLAAAEPADVFRHARLPSGLKFVSRYRPMALPRSSDGLARWGVAPQAPLRLPRVDAVVAALADPEC